MMLRITLFVRLLLSLLLGASIIQTSAATPLSISATPEKFLKRRFDLPLSGFYEHVVQTLQFIGPATAFSSNPSLALQLFYTKIVLKVISEWAPHQQPVDVLMISYGAFQLAFATDKLGKNIPWNVIAEFAAQMILRTQNGYTSTFDAGFWDATRTLGVFVSLRVVPDWFPHPPQGYAVQLNHRV